MRYMTIYETAETATPPSHVSSKARIIELTKRFLTIAGEGEVRLKPDQPAYRRA
jgi:hypothetical protein